MDRVSRLKKVEDCLSLRSGAISLDIDSELVNTLFASPSQVLGHANLILAGIKSSGKIDDFVLFTDELTAFWEVLQYKTLPHPITVMIGVGGRRIPQLEVDLSAEKKNQCLISIGPYEKKPYGHPRWLEHNINQKLAAKNCPWKIDPGSVEGIWQRSSTLGLPVNKFVSYKKLSSKALSRDSRHWRLSLRPITGDIVVMINNVQDENSETMEKEIIRAAKGAIAQISLDHRNTGLYWVFSKHIKKRVQEAFHGPQCVGFSLPFSFIAAARVDVFTKFSKYDPLLPLATMQSIRSNINLSSKNLIGVDADCISINKCLEQLEDERLVTYTKQSQELKVTPAVKVHGFITGHGHSTYIKHALNAAKLGIIDTTANRRDYKTMMIGIAKDRIPEYRKNLESYQIRIIDFISRSQGPELYQINLQFFPLSRISPRPLSDLKQADNTFRNSRWVNLLIRELTGLPGARSDPSWFAVHLVPNIPVSDIKSSLISLRKGGFIHFNPNTLRLKQTQKDIIAQEPSYTQGTQFHTDVLDLALYTQPWEQDTGILLSTSFTCDHNGRQELQKIYDDFLFGMFQAASKTIEPNIIYQLSLQLFPLF